MESITKRPLFAKIKVFSQLTKPGIIFGNGINTSLGLMMGCRGSIHFPLFFSTLVGLSLVIGSACTLNNYIDRDYDRKMSRTNRRPLPLNAISIPSTFLFAILLAIAGFFLLFLSVPILAFFLSVVGFFNYVIVYSFLKYYSPHATLIGSIGGAIPPLVGYCTTANSLDLGGYLLFSLIVLWQMPHFFAIAIYRIDDYSSAKIPVLPLQKGLKTTQKQMCFYIIGFTGCLALLSYFHYLTSFHLFITALVGLSWLFFCLEGFSTHDHKDWAKKMFILSLIVITTLCITIPLSIQKG